MMQGVSLEELWTRLGVGPNHIAFSPVAQRLIDVALANINFVKSLALVGAVLYVITLLVRTMVPLRVVGIVSTIFLLPMAHWLER